jgi:shikimate dehydrogenase
MKGPARRLAGFNITLPHKEKIIPYLDFLVPKARMIGAVNTVVQRRGKLIGFNTDGDGYLMSLREEKDFDVRGAHVTLLGAGGAARSLAVSLAFSQVKGITIANRSVHRARKLAGYLASHFKKASFAYSELSGVSFERALKKTDLLINTTSVGLGGSRFENFPWDQVPARTLISDIVYTPRWTPFLNEAKRRGYAVHTGEGMLLHQGALAFELWTGHRPDMRVMRRALLRGLSQWSIVNSRNK